MIFVAILISLVLDRYVGQLPDWRQYKMLTALTQWICQRSKAKMLRGAFGVLLTLLPGCLAIAVVQAYLYQGFLIIPGTLFAIVVVLYSLGPRDLDRDVDEYAAACETGDEEQITRVAGQILPGHVPESPQERNRAVADAVFVEANERMFAVLFWFSVLGPVGAFLFRGVAVVREASADGDSGEYHPAAARLHDLLAWLPARLLAVCYGLSGHFDGAIRGWTHAGDREPSGFVHGSAEFLIPIGHGALGLKKEEEATLEDVTDAMSLVWRSVVIWVVVVSLLTLSGLAS